MYTFCIPEKEKIYIFSLNVSIAIDLELKKIRPFTFSILFSLIFKFIHACFGSCYYPGMIFLSLYTPVNNQLHSAVNCLFYVWSYYLHPRESQLEEYGLVCKNLYPVIVSFLLNI